MRNSLASALVALLVPVGIGLLTSEGWPGYAMGAGYSLSLWVMLYFGSFSSTRRGFVSARTYATAAALAVPLGYVFYRIGDENGTWWALAFILVGAILPAAATTKAARLTAGDTRDEG